MRISIRHFFLTCILTKYRIRTDNPGNERRLCPSLNRVHPTNKLKKKTFILNKCFLPAIFPGERFSGAAPSRVTPAANARGCRVQFRPDPEEAAVRKIIFFLPASNRPVQTGSHDLIDDTSD